MWNSAVSEIFTHTLHASVLNRVISSGMTVHNDVCRTLIDADFASVSRHSRISDDFTCYKNYTFEDAHYHARPPASSYPSSTTIWINRGTIL